MMLTREMIGQGRINECGIEYLNKHNVRFPFIDNVYSVTFEIDSSLEYFHTLINEVYRIKIPVLGDTMQSFSYFFFAAPFDDIDFSIENKNGKTYFIPMTADDTIELNKHMSYLRSIVNMDKYEGLITKIYYSSAAKGFFLVFEGSDWAEGVMDSAPHLFLLDYFKYDLSIVEDEEEEEE